MILSRMKGILAVQRQCALLRRTYSVAAHTSSLTCTNVRAFRNCVGVSQQCRLFSVAVVRLQTAEAVRQAPPAPQAASQAASPAVSAPEGAASPEGAADSSELVLDFIPEKPVPIDATTLLGEPTFDSIGLASWWPSGRLQYFMEQVYLSTGLEWWQTIIITTICIRALVFPLVIMAQKNNANMNNNMPGMAELQEKLTLARKRGDMYESAQLGHELKQYMNQKGINPLKNAVPILFQLPIFMSMFFGLRGMAKCPVESMETGGLFWFENLTMADPFYVLPLMTSTTMFLQLKLGTEGASINSMGPIGRYLMMGLPFLLVPVTMNFPAAVTFYWFTTNCISVVQARLIRVPQIGKFLGVPKLIQWDRSKVAGGNKGFRQSIRETLDNWKVQGQIQDRRAHDEQKFKDAGVTRPKKTFKYDPTKPIALKK